VKTTEVLTAKRIKPMREALVIVLPDREVRIPWEACSSRLAAAKEEQRLSAELSPGGYGIHWHLLDEDLSISGLLASDHERTRS
jgi:uncharacterized protein DUF2442